MRAVVLQSSEANLNDLSLIQLAIPAPDVGQVLLRIRYASLNPVDYKLIAAKPLFWQYPYIPGLDLVGEVVKLGNPTRGNFRIGDIVALHGNLTYGGALAEYCVQPEHVLVKIPTNFNLALAAALPCAGLTAYQALVRKMNITKALGLKVISSYSTKNLDYVSDHYPSQCDLASMGDELLELMHKSKTRPAIHEYPLEEFAQAFADLQQNTYPGKIVINCITYTHSI